MMGGGYGPGMMGGGYGPGMMGGGYGPGMMGGGYGMGMMGGYGPGMMMGGGYGRGFAAALDLSDSQQQKIADIRRKLFDKQWEQMRQMHDQMPAVWHTSPGEKVDVDQVMKTTTGMMAIGQQMMRERLEAHNQVLDVLTEQQRKQLQDFYRGGWGPQGDDDQ